MSSSSSNSSSRYRGMKKFMTSVEKGVECDCGLEAPCWEAWKESTLDPGRRFFGCSRWKDPRLNCKFFKWADPEYTVRSREVIQQLNEKLRLKTDEAAIYRDDLEALQKKKAKLEDDMEVWHRRDWELLKKKDEQVKKMKKLFWLLWLTGIALCMVFVVKMCSV